ncbi:myb-like protein X isoform X1 [Monomorium pharaonis]|uniref:myb-like protein X isoform X1 n=1 Tax=Monomorium pharaonis TaxID=307658 RepID=UPI0017475029|nr:myb-like protein X isoform X1 [Monomorium pharaonis]
MILLRALRVPKRTQPYTRMHIYIYIYIYVYNACAEENVSYVWIDVAGLCFTRVISASLILLILLLVPQIFTVHIMFIINCKNDGSYCLVNDNAVICDYESVKKGDAVTFFYNQKSYQGVVIMRSDNVSSIEEEFQKLNKRQKLRKTNRKREASNSPDDNCDSDVQQSDEPALSQKKKNSSKDDQIKKSGTKRNVKGKKIDVKKNSIAHQRQVQTTFNHKYKAQNDVHAQLSLSSDTSTDEENTETRKTQYSATKKADIRALNTLNVTKKREGSPTKEELKRLLQIALDKSSKSLEDDIDTSGDDTNSSIQLQHDIATKSNNNDNSTSDNNKDEADKENDMFVLPDDSTDQLFGKNCPDDKMMLLMSEIYCQKRVLMSAIASSLKPSHLARRLLSGVFKPEALLRCTITGQSVRSLGKTRYEEKFDCLDPIARDAIIGKHYNLQQQRINNNFQKLIYSFRLFYKTWSCKTVADTRKKNYYCCNVPAVGGNAEDRET